MIYRVALIHETKQELTTLWGAKDFYPTFPKLARKVFRYFCQQIFSAKIIKTFLCVISKKRKVFICFSANVGRHFSKLNKVGRHVFPAFQGFHPDFQELCPDF